MHPILWIIIVLALALVGVCIAIGVHHAITKPSAVQSAERVQDYEEGVAELESVARDLDRTQSEDAHTRVKNGASEGTADTQMSWPRSNSNVVLPRFDETRDGYETRSSLLTLWVDFSTQASACGLTLFPVHSTHRAVVRRRMPRVPFLMFGAYGHEVHKLLEACENMPENAEVRVHPYIHSGEPATNDVENECDVLIRRDNVCIFVQLVLADDVYPRATPPRPPAPKSTDTDGVQNAASASETVHVEYFLRDGTVLDTHKAKRATFFGAEVHMLDEGTASRFDIMDTML